VLKPVYPAILTRADWDKNKGTIGKAPNELGIGPAVDAAQKALNNIDWEFLAEINAAKLEAMIGDVDGTVFFGMSERVRQQRGFIRAACDSQLALADACARVVVQYGRAVTFPKAAIEHVGRMKTAAVDFARTLAQENGQAEFVLTRKAFGAITLRRLPIHKFLEHPEIFPPFEVLVRKQHNEQSWGFVMSTLRTTKAQLPPPVKVPQIVKDYVRDNDGNMGSFWQGKLLALDDSGDLVDPPAAKRQEVLLTWKGAHDESKKMFSSTIFQFAKSLKLQEPSSDFLLTPFLQFPLPPLVL